MARTSTALTATVTLVRGEIVSAPLGVSSSILIEVSVKASDLLALLTPAEKAALSSPGQLPALGVGCVITDDGGTSLGDRSSFPGVTDIAVFGSLTTGLINGVAAYLKAH
jgi:hypothetical protein